MREIVLDTETTGLDPENGDRIVEIGCVELVNLIPTGNEFHTYINPQRDMPEPAFAVHGLSARFLADHAVFADIAGDFLAFIGADPLVIHNAEFDLRFLNAELASCGRPAIDINRAIDTMLMARSRFPGAQASLDALCRRFSIDTARREKHGALVDSHLLAAVYLELTGGRQQGLGLAGGAGEGAVAGEETAEIAEITEITGAKKRRQDGAENIRPPRPHAPTPEEIERHGEMLALLDEPLWTQ